MVFDKSPEMKKCTPPPRQVLDLLAPHLDPTTLAAAACVCKSWSLSMSSDHLWKPIFSSAYPSLTNLRSTFPAAPVSYRRLYSLCRAAENRRNRPPPKPHLSLHDLIFAIDIQSSHNNHSVSTVTKPGGELKLDKNGIFRFDIDVEGGGPVVFEALESLKISWNVVLEGFKGVFNVMECRGKGSFVLGLEGWFSKELPSPGCCSGGGASGMVADLRLGMRESGSGKVVVEKMSVGVMSIVSWRYVGVDDVLRYFQHFLLPNDNNT